MSIPTQNLVISKYTEFNKMHQFALLEREPTKFQNYVVKLLSLQEEIETSIKKGAALPEKTTAIALSDNLSAKLQGLLSRDFKSAPTSSSPFSNSSKSCVKGCVGFENLAANCWANALLHMYIHSPERQQVLLDVGNFYASGKLLDADRMEKVEKDPLEYVKNKDPLAHVEKASREEVLAHFKHGLINEERWKAGIALFDAIGSPYVKLSTINDLINSGYFSIARQFIKRLPQEYQKTLPREEEIPILQEAIAALQKEIRFDAINTRETLGTVHVKLSIINDFIKSGRLAVALQLIKRLPKEYQQKLPQEKGSPILQQAIAALQKEIREARLKQAGQWILDAVAQYHKCKANSQSVPAAVSQNFRVALNIFFGDANPFTGIEHLSANPSAFEDAHEPIPHIMGRYEAILKLNNRFPSPIYALLKTSSFYQPQGTPRPANTTKVENNNYSTLSMGNISQSAAYDYQIILDPPTKANLSIETLLEETYFTSPAVEGSDLPVYLLDNRTQEQSFQLEREERSFIGKEAPENLLLVIKRFAVNNYGRPSKIETPVIANRVITLPANGTSKKNPLAYELQSFFIHQPGHYIAYRKMGNDWVECNDSALRLLSTQEVDTILQGRARTYSGDPITPYALDYRLVDPAKQKEMLALSQTLRKNAAVACGQCEKQLSLKDHEHLIDQLKTLYNLLKDPTFKEKEIRAMLKSIRDFDRNGMAQLCSILGISLGMKSAQDGADLFLRDNPKKLLEITASWYRATTDNIIGQLIKSEQEKLAIRKCEEDITNGKLLQKKTTVNTALLAEKQKTLIQLRAYHMRETIRAYYQLLKNRSLSKQQLNALFNIIELPEALKNDLYHQLGGKQKFQEDPRILLTITPDPLIQVEAGKDEEVPTDKLGRMNTPPKMTSKDDTEDDALSYLSTKTTPQKKINNKETDLFSLSLFEDLTISTPLKSGQKEKTLFHPFDAFDW